MRSDTQILEAVLEALRCDPLVGPTEVGVEVDDGIVTLSGTVENYETKLAAIEVVHRAAGVLDVVNDIQIHASDATGRTDADIAAAVRRALQADAFVPDERIRTTITRGWVTLEGTVSRRRLLVAAEQVVRRVPGVVHVFNDIAVVPRDAFRPADTQVGSKRPSERTVNRLDLAADDGTVTFAGAVDASGSEVT